MSYNNSYKRKPVKLTVNLYKPEVSFLKEDRNPESGSKSRVPGRDRHEIGIETSPVSEYCQKSIFKFRLEIGRDKD